jgi:hypothetical protein
MLHQLSHSGDARGAEQFAELAEDVVLVIGERSDQVGALAGAAAGPLPVS